MIYILEIGTNQVKNVSLCMTFREDCHFSKPLAPYIMNSRNILSVFHALINRLLFLLLGASPGRDRTVDGTGY